MTDLAERIARLACESARVQSELENSCSALVSQVHASLDKLDDRVVGLDNEDASDLLALVAEARDGMRCHGEALMNSQRELGVVVAAIAALDMDLACG